MSRCSRPKEGQERHVGARHHRSYGAHAQLAEESPRLPEQGRADPGARGVLVHAHGEDPAAGLGAELEGAELAEEVALESLALEDENVQRHIEGKTVRKVIVVPGRLINIVVG